MPDVQMHGECKCQMIKSYKRDERDRGSQSLAKRLLDVKVTYESDLVTIQHFLFLFFPK